MLRCTLLSVFALVTAAAADDAILDLARHAATDYGTKLPDYVCEETMERYAAAGYSARNPPRMLDKIVLEVVNEHGNETFRNIRVDGKPVEKVDKGLWSVGVFGPLMASLFDPRVAATFRRRGTGREAGRDVVRYDFDVPEATSNWVITAPPDQVKPAYRGSIWVESATGRVLRHEIETTSLPASFHDQEASLKVRYRFFKINGQEYLLPQTMESSLCPRGYFYCDRAQATYSNCHKFAAESSLKFDAE